MDVSVARVDVKIILSFNECLVSKNCSVAMISNYVSAKKASFVLYDQPFHILDHPQVKYFQKSMRVNRPLDLNTTLLTLLVLKAYPLLVIFFYLWPSPESCV